MAWFCVIDRIIIVQICFGHLLFSTFRLIALWSSTLKFALLLDLAKHKKSSWSVLFNNTTIEVAVVFKEDRWRLLFTNASKRKATLIFVSNDSGILFCEKLLQTSLEAPPRYEFFKSQVFPHSTSTKLSYETLIISKFQYCSKTCSSLFSVCPWLTTTYHWWVMFFCVTKAPKTAIDKTIFLNEVLRLMSHNTILTFMVYWPNNIE